MFELNNLPSAKKNKNAINGISSKKTTDKEDSSTPSVLTFDAYGNLTTGSDANAEVAYSHEIPSLAEFDYILDSFENGAKPPPVKNKKITKLDNGSIEKKKSKLKLSSHNSSRTGISQEDLKLAFKTEFNASNAALSTSRYGRNRKVKSLDDGFLLGTVNFNELRKITSPSKKVQYESEVFKTEGVDPTPSSVAGLLPDVTQSFDILTDKILNFSSEDEFVPEKVRFKSEKLKNSSKKKSKINNRRSCTWPSVPIESKISLTPKSKSVSKRNESLPKPKKSRQSSSKVELSKENSNKNSKLPELEILHSTKDMFSENTSNSIDAHKVQTRRSKSISSSESNSKNSTSSPQEKNLISSSRSISKVNDSEDLKSNPKLSMQSYLKSVLLETSDAKSTSDDVVVIEDSDEEVTELCTHFKASNKDLNNKSKLSSAVKNKMFENQLPQSALNGNDVHDGDANDAVTTFREKNILKVETLQEEVKYDNLAPNEVEGTKEPLKQTNAMKIENDCSNLNENKKQNEELAVIEQAFLEAPDTSKGEIIKKEEGCLFFIGDLVWVAFKAAPMWPGIICCPDNEDSYTKYKNTASNFRAIRLYHAKFLCDNNQKAWVTTSCLRMFEGKQKFLESLGDDMKRFLNPKLYSKNVAESCIKAIKFTRNPSKAPHSIYERWIKAMGEAEHGLTLDRYQRVQKFVDEDIKINAKKVKNKKKKMKIKKLKNKISDEEFSGFEENSSAEIKTRRMQRLNDTLNEDNFEEYIHSHMQSLMSEGSFLEDDTRDDSIRKYRKAKAPRKSSLAELFDNDESGSECSSLSSYKSKKSFKNEVTIEESSGTYRLVRNEKVCFACETVSQMSTGADMIKCKGSCSGVFHMSCVGITPGSSTDFKCVSCLTNTHKCFCCKNSEGVLTKCSVHSCGKFYHEECIRKWPQVSKGRQTEKLVCPRHTCHMCTANADDMNDVTARTAPFTRCLRCPTTYHTGELCGAAGIEEISLHYHICSKHIKLPKNSNQHHCNVNWCFYCSKGGSLLLCDQCPAAFHSECMGIPAPEDGYVCEDCENGKFPIYGDIVWAKLGAYRWWPGQVLHPKYIPDNIENLWHVQGMFCVHFFGSNDYYWMSRGRTFLYQDGDQGSKGCTSKVLEQQFKRAMEEAQVAFQKQKERREQYERNRYTKGKLKPPHYVRIDTNRPVGNVRLLKLDPSQATKCDCDPYSENPCGSDDKCINRMLMVECIREVCPAGDRCRNQRFQKREYPNVFSFKTSERGWGLKTKDFVKQGDFCIEYVGELIDDAEFRRRITAMHEFNEQNYYFLTVETDRMIDAGPKGNLSRFMNHSCQPNCETQKWTVGADTRVGLFAIHDIEPDSELTFNYNLECVGTEKKVCNCGAPNCSGFIGSKVQKSDANSLKKLNGKKMKKKKIKISQETDDDCFRCGTPGDLILCDKLNCPKGYHLECLSLTTLPKGKWICPWHHCDDCGNRSTVKCSKCPNSFCRNHSTDNFYPGETNICLDHPMSEVEDVIVIDPEIKLDSSQIENDVTPKSENVMSSLKNERDTNKCVRSRVSTTEQTKYSSQDKKVNLNHSRKNAGTIQKSTAHPDDTLVPKKKRGRPRPKKKRGRPRKYFPFIEKSSQSPVSDSAQSSPKKLDRVCTSPILDSSKKNSPSQPSSPILKRSKVGSTVHKSPSKKTTRLSLMSSGTTISPRKCRSITEPKTTASISKSPTHVAKRSRMKQDSNSDKILKAKTPPRKCSPTSSKVSKRKRESSTPAESESSLKKRRILRSLNEVQETSDGLSLLQDSKNLKNVEQNIDIEILNCKEN